MIEFMPQITLGTIIEIIIISGGIMAAYYRMRAETRVLLMKYNVLSNSLAEHLKEVEQLKKSYVPVREYEIQTDAILQALKDLKLAISEIQADIKGLLSRK